MLYLSTRRQYLVSIVVLVGLLVGGGLVLVEALAARAIILVALAVKRVASGRAGRGLRCVAVRAAPLPAC